VSESRLTDALAAIEPLLLEGDYALLGFERGTAPPGPPELTAESYAVRVDDPFETTLLVRREIADRLPAAASRVDGLRVILLVGQLDPELTGFVSTVAGAMAERGIPLVPVGAATRDHLVVPGASWPEALAILRGLRDAARSLAEPDA
jgi:hypothetical protein